MDFTMKLDLQGTGNIINKLKDSHEKTFYLLCIMIIVTMNLKAQTAHSVATAHAMSSVEKGFDSLRYNPASLVFTDRKLGFSIASIYVRAYNNTLSTDDILEMNRLVNLSSFFENKFKNMPKSGLDSGADFDLFKSALFINFNHWSSPVYEKDAQELKASDTYHFKNEIITKKIIINKEKSEITQETIEEEEPIIDIILATNNLQTNTENGVYIKINPQNTELLHLTLHSTQGKEEINEDTLTQYKSGDKYFIPLKNLLT